jgi:hypothetical protein
MQNNQKTVLYAVFCHFGAIWAPSNGPKKVCKGLQMIMICGAMSKNKIKPLTKSLGPFF